MCYKRVIFVPETTALYIKELLTLNPEMLFSKYNVQQGVLYHQKIVFTKEISAELKISLDESGNVYLNGFLKKKSYLSEDVENIPCIERSEDFFGIWKFFYKGVEYKVQMVTGIQK